MTEVLITFFSALTYVEVIILILLVFFLYLIYIKITDDDYYSELQEIKDQHKARLWNYVSGELKVIEGVSIKRTAGILDTMNLEVSPEALRQFDMFGLILDKALNDHLFESIKTAVRINGFHGMNDAELHTYIDDKSLVLLTDSRSYINSMINYFPLLRGTDDKRFTLDEAKKFYGKIVHKSIKNYQDELGAINELKTKYSLWHKINFIGAIIRKFSNKTD